MEFAQGAGAGGPVGMIKGIGEAVGSKMPGFITKPLGGMARGLGRMAPMLKAGAAGAGKMAMGIGKIAGPIGVIAAAVLAILMISKLFRNLLGGVFQILSMMMDIMVIPLIPVFMKLMKIMLDSLPFIMAFSELIGDYLEAYMPVVGKLLGFILKVLGGVILMTIIALMKIMMTIFKIINAVYFALLGVGDAIEDGFVRLAMLLVQAINALKIFGDPVYDTSDDTKWYSKKNQDALDYGTAHFQRAGKELLESVTLWGLSDAEKHLFGMDTTTKVQNRQMGTMNSRGGLAFLHQGEAVIPRWRNQGSQPSRIIYMQNNFYITGSSRDDNSKTALEVRAQLTRMIVAEGVG